MESPGCLFLAPYRAFPSGLHLPVLLCLFARFGDFQELHLVQLPVAARFILE